ncbi:tyrosine phosphatase [Trypanosoma theileri]|uniref:phosphatidylinositol-3,4,5-trisphosphate 3-phosphatase n=1 Tax=Trypanosoma theileri TaxID=67003 RepID=A0A1X0P8U9_9TRYP|nr:tyrosine phosphatase [Trypanosoma theileri]ORC93298.1 tyrosine phosphatase [Trypanosoma theileri]
MGCCCVVARHAVSQKKRRTVDRSVPNYGAVDLDLVQVHKNIVCMGFPALGLESFYRNQYKVVLHYLDYKYGTDYMVYNLCAESQHRYNLNFFHGRVREYPFPDHWACPLTMIPSFVEDAVKFISCNSPLGEGVVVIHCKAGKGRTGLLTCCLLMCIEPLIEGSAIKAIEYYGIKRTLNGRGLTIPSQIRYVEYYEVLLKQYNGQVPSDIPIIDILSFQIRGIEAKTTISSCIWYTNKGKCNLDLTSSARDNIRIEKSANYVTTVNLAKHLFFKELSEDIRLEFLNGDEIIGALSFHTLFIQKEYSYTQLDRINKMKLSEESSIYFEFASSS